MSNINQLPMSAKKAVGSTRSLSKAISNNGAKILSSKGDPKFKDKPVQKLLNDYNKMLEKWLEERGEGLAINKDLEKISDLLTKNIQIWFNRNIRPFNHEDVTEEDSDTQSDDSDVEMYIEGKVPNYQIAIHKSDNVDLSGNIADTESF